MRLAGLASAFCLAAGLLHPGQATLGAAAPPAAPSPVTDEGVVALTPNGTDTATCTDTSLRLTLDRPVVLGSTGRLQVHRADGSVVDTIDLADPASRQRTVGGARSDFGELHRWNYEPASVDGTTATVHLHRTLPAASRFYVTMTPGFIEGFDGISDRTTWQLRTRSAPPAGSAELSVEADGSGDFCTLQGAVDHVPAGNDQNVEISVGRGHYREIVYVGTDRPHLTIRGADREGTVIEYANNDRLNGDAAMRQVPPEQSYCPKRVLPTPDRWNCWRAVVGIDADDVRLKNLTVHNLTPKGGSQAEAVRGNGDRIVLDRVSLKSYQDTLRLQGRAFVTDSYIEGDVDFVWGTGGVFMQDTELKALNPGYYTQIRNEVGEVGNVFLRTRLTRAAGVPDDSQYLSRIETNRFPGSQVLFIGSAMDTHVRDVGWQITPDDCGAAAQLEFGEYASTDLTGRPLDTSRRLACSSQLTPAEAERWSDPAYVLGGWDPRTDHQHEED